MKCNGGNDVSVCEDLMFNKCKVYQGDQIQNLCSREIASLIWKETQTENIRNSDSQAN